MLIGLRASVRVRYRRANPVRRYRGQRQQRFRIPLILIPSADLHTLTGRVWSRRSPAPCSASSHLDLLRAHRYTRYPSPRPREPVVNKAAGWSAQCAHEPHPPSSKAGSRKTPRPRLGTPRNPHHNRDDLGAVVDEIGRSTPTVALEAASMKHGMPAQIASDAARHSLLHPFPISLSADLSALGVPGGNRLTPEHEQFCLTPNRYQNLNLTPSLYMRPITS